MNPDKILVKKYYGNIFYYDMEPKKLKCFRICEDESQEISIQKVMDKFIDTQNE